MDAATRKAGEGGGRTGISAIVEYDYTAKEPDELDLAKGAIIQNIKCMPGGWWEGTLQANGKTGMFPDNFVRVLDGNEDNVTLRDKSATSNRRCKVIYSYTQVNDDELSLAVGDVIEFLGEVEEGWWRGRLKSKVGVFPSNFVISIESSPVFASKRPTGKTIPLGGAVSTSSSISSSSSSNTMTTKKVNRLSFHNSKEDLLNSTTTTTTINATSNGMPSATVTATGTVAAADDAAPSLPPKPQREYCRVEFPYAPQNEDELELKMGDIITIITTELPDKGWWKGELRGRIGVFPDNFVKLLPPEVSPLNDSQQTTHSKTAKISNAGNIHTSAGVTSSTTSTNITSASSSTATATSKVFIKKSGSTSSTQSSNRKDSFGSRDSLNDILSETGLQTGNVAAQRKSLENKNLDLLNAPDASTRLGLKKQQVQETKTIHSSSVTTSTTNMSSSSNSSTSEIRKSLESLDEKNKSPPPVLTKKPSVPTKKSTTVTSVAGNIFSGLKQKVKNVESKLTTAASHDSADGVGSSKMSSGGVADSGSGGVSLMRRAATIAVEDSDFDRVERASILSDMRAGRVKAPKRRPPSAAINAIGESNNNNSTYLNGSGDSGSADVSQNEDGKPQSSDDNSTGEEQLAKPKPREWEKKKAPWMEELKASQVKKKTSPNVEPRTLTGGTSVAERTSKLLEETKITNNTSSSFSSTKNIVSSTTSTTNHSINSTRLQSPSVTSSAANAMQQSMTVESSQQLLRKELSSANATEAMTKSLSGKLVSETNSIINNSSSSTIATSNNISTIDDVRARPNSLSIRNRSISPSLGNTRTGLKSTSSASPAATNNTEATAISNSTSSTTAKLNAISNHHSTHSSANAGVTIHENNIPAVGRPTSSNESLRVIELEKRVEKLEALVHSQQRTIEELVRTVREETDRVKVLRGELDKYAQCVTQV